MSGCKTKPIVPPPPPPPDDPFASLHFESVEANEITKIYLDFILTVKNPGHENADMIIENWDIIINDMEIKKGFDFFIDNSTDKYGFSVVPGTDAFPGAREIPVRLELDVPALIAEGMPVRDDLIVDLALDIFHVNNVRGQEPPVLIRAAETAVFPYIREPVFTITSIAILQAELINTRFRVGIKIDNPNHFPVDLSSLEYELYGNGLLWADGRERNIISVPAKSSVQGNLFLLMNFINMKRDLLDQIIRLDDVNYGFNGEALVTTGVEYLPRFRTEFNLSGYSKVFEN